MTTIAEQNGIVAGKQYRYTSTTQRLESEIGKVFILDLDDGTRLPYFREVLGNGKFAEDRVCIYVDGDAGDKLTLVTDSDEVTFKFEVNELGSSFSTNKRLSFQQVQEVIRIIGVL